MRQPSIRRSSCPPPPLPGSAAARADVEALLAADRVRTDAGQAQSKADGKNQETSFFAPALGKDFALDRLPETASLFATVRREEKAVADHARNLFRRDRPWIVDATLHSGSADDAPQTSYPSNHATSGFALAAILHNPASNVAPTCHRDSCRIPTC